MIAFGAVDMHVHMAMEMATAEIEAIAELVDMAKAKMVIHAGIHAIAVRARQIN